MARYTSPTQGKDGTSHFGDLKIRHVVSPISMLGDLIPVMTGVAMAGRYLGQNLVAMTWIGDGGSSTGAFHEGLNLAATQKAPFVLVVENNQWAYSTPVARQVPIRNLADRAVAYGIASRIVDGNDVVAVYNTTRNAVDECRAGRGPVLIEVKTMRMKGHAQHDPADYVPQAMLDYWKSQDPIARYESYLTQHRIWDLKKKSEIDARIERELDVDQKFAEESPLPPPELAEEGVYCEGCHKIEAEWHRSKKEVTPPTSSVEAVWKVADFGSFSGANAAPAPSTGPGSNDSKLPHAELQPASKTHPSAPSAVAVAPESEVPLRVPFGRGPKDRTFERERQDKTPPKPPRNKRRRH
jgi:TPP-dependent pyruvate/acetoin dehydrogenase alpha subunit